MHYTDFCDAPAAKLSAGGNTADYMLTNWIWCFEGIVGYHSHAWEPRKKTVQKNIEETQALNVLDRTTLWGGGNQTGST